MSHNEAYKIKLDDFATPDDNTDLDATTGRHGLLPKLGGGTTNFLRADGAWAAPGASAGYHWAKISNDTLLSITGATSATLNRMHVVSGTSADYPITISDLSPTAGDVIGFYVKDWSAANKQYTLGAGGTVKIAGRTRYLVLLHTNVVLLRWDGTDWQPLVLGLSIPAVHVEASSDAGQSLTANTTDIQYEDEAVDTYGAWSGTVFTAPVAGTYLVSFCFAPSTATSVTPNVYVNGSNVRSSMFGPAANGTMSWYCSSHRLAAGDTVKFRSANSCTRNTAPASNWLSITRVGDY